MASISLFLKNPNTEKSSIICKLTDGRAMQVRIPTGLSIKTRHWSKNNSKVLSADTEAIEKNRSLKNLKKKVLDVYLDAKGKGIITDAEYIRDQIKPKVKANPASKEFWNVWEYYLESRKDRFKPRSFKKFDYFKKHLLSFEEATKIPWTLETVTKNKLEKFQTYFYDNGIGTQTTAKYIGVFKMLLNWAFENNYTTNQDYRAFKPIQQKDTLKVALTPEEVETIRKTNFHDKPHLENAKQLFILSTLTGLRFSDYSQIKREHLKKEADGTFSLQKMQEKTGDIIELPLTKEAENIVRQLIEGNIHAISNQKMNDYVKDLCKIAKIDEPFETHQFKGKLVVTTTKPKYKLISTHTGRRTFATNLLLQGIPAEAVMLFTGHKDYKSFSKYVNIPKKTKMDMVKNALNQMSVA